MPSKLKKLAATAASLPKVPTEQIDQFVSGPMTAGAVNDACLAFRSSAPSASS
jgi:putative transposase